MSRNLLRSGCCSNIVRLEDLRSRSIEFRRYDSEPVVLGTKCVCPTCQTEYFAWWKSPVVDAEYGMTRGFEIDLSYYYSFDGDQSSDKNTIRHLCLDNAEDHQELL